MLPCCAVGVLFMVQLLALERWFRKHILHQEIPDEEDYWKPEKQTLKERAAAILKDKKKRKILLGIVAVELAVVVIVHANGGFHLYKKAFAALLSRSPGTEQSAAMDETCEHCAKAETN